MDGWQMIEKEKERIWCSQRPLELNLNRLWPRTLKRSLFSIKSQAVFLPWLLWSPLPAKRNKNWRDKGYQYRRLTSFSDQHLATKYARYSFQWFQISVWTDRKCGKWIRGYDIVISVLSYSFTQCVKSIWINIINTYSKENNTADLVCWQLFSFPIIPSSPLPLWNPHLHLCQLY